MDYLATIPHHLVVLNRMLKPTASSYLHYESIASRYLKVLMDAVFGPTSFRSEIDWKRSCGKSAEIPRYPSMWRIGSSAPRHCRLRGGRQDKPRSCCSRRLEDIDAPVPVATFTGID